MRFLPALSLVAVLLSLTACSWFSSNDEAEPADLASFDETIDLDKKWFNHIGNQGDEELYIRLAPAMDGDVIYAANASGDVMAIDRIHGKDLWDIDTDEALISAVGAGGGLVLVGNVNGLLIALQQADGAELWRSQLSSELLSAAQVDEGIVVALTVDGKAVGVDAQTGKQRWQYSSTAPSLTLRTSATPLLQNGIAYLAFANGKVVALNVSTGLLLWERQVTLPEGRNELERMIDVDGPLLVVGSDLYVGSYQGRVAMLDRIKGNIQWIEKASVSGSLASGNGNLYLTQDDDTVVALKMATGRRLWENRLMANRDLSAPVVLGDYVALTDAEGYIHVLNQSDGQLASRYSLWRSRGVRCPLLSDGETLYVLSNSGKLTALVLDKQSLDK